LKPGIHDGVPAEQYFSLPAASRSGLEHIERSPLHYYAQCLDPNRRPIKETPALRVGSAIHCAILEPERFGAEYRRKPNPEEFPNALDTADQYKETCKRLGLPVSGTKEVLKARIREADLSVQFFDDVERDFSKYKLLSWDEMTACVNISQNFRKSRLAELLFVSGKAERTIVWQDKETGVPCKARLDWLTDDYTTIADIKSAEDASRAGFSKSFANYNYHRQVAWYSEGVEALTGQRPIFVFPVYEKEPPYATANYYAKTEIVEHGKREMRRLLRTYADCLSKQKWPGYDDEILPIDTPAWKLKQFDNVNAELETY
jgi:hypothetical protein